MKTQVSFASHIRAEELAELALKMANTFSPMGHEQPLAEVVCEWLKQNQLNAYLQPILSDRANVVAVLPGSGGGKSLIFNSHLDSEVSGPEYDWGMNAPDINRAGAWREGDRLFGHTVLNDRGLMATTMVALKALRDAGVPLRGNVIFTGVPGETGAAPIDEHQGLTYEGKGFGSRHLVTHGVRGDYALVAETTDFGISWLACGACYFKISVPGLNQYTPRSIRPNDIRENPNAIVKMSHVIHALEEWAMEYEAKHTFDSPCGHVVPKVVIGAIRGGIPYRPNRTSPHCAIFVDVRLAPGQDPLAVEREVQKVVDSLQLGGKVETYLARPGVVGKNTEPLAQAISTAFKNVTGMDPTPCAPQVVVSMWRDINVFNEAGIPAITFGIPRRKDPGTNRLCFELADLVNMADVYAQTAFAICK